MNLNKKQKEFGRELAELLLKHDVQISTDSFESVVGITFIFSGEEVPSSCWKLTPISINTYFLKS